MKNKNLTASIAVATAAALMLAGCGKKDVASSETTTVSTETAESAIVEEATAETSESTSDNLSLSTETMHYSADDEHTSLKGVCIL